VARIVNRQAPAAFGVDVGEGVIRKLGALTGGQPGHASMIAHGPGAARM
jgi:hypothetical protein